MKQFLLITILLTNLSCVGIATAVKCQNFNIGINDIPGIGFEISPQNIISLRGMCRPGYKQLCDKIKEIIPFYRAKTGKEDVIHIVIKENGALWSPDKAPESWMGSVRKTCGPLFEQVSFS